MPEAYEVHDGQFIQTVSATSAADALLIGIPGVPAGKVWTLLRAYLTTSAAETQDYWFAILSQGRYYPITAPVEATINSAISRAFPCLREGMEIKLFQDERIYAFRDVATAGSTISCYASIIENDLPFYVEKDKHAERERKQRAMPVSFVTRRALGGFGMAGVGRGLGGGVPRVK
jgi:hypothetical protein